MKRSSSPAASIGSAPIAVGRDFLSRLIYGTRVSLIVGFAVQIVAVVIGLSLGTLAGMLGGWVDYIMMRWVEVLTAIPGILFALFLISIMGRNASGYESLFNVVLAIGLIGWVDICRLTRAQLLSLREKEFVTAAHALGVEVPGGSPRAICCPMRSRR